MSLDRRERRMDLFVSVGMRGASLEVEDDDVEAFVECDFL